MQNLDGGSSILGELHRDVNLENTVVPNAETFERYSDRCIDK